MLVSNTRLINVSITIMFLLHFDDENSFDFRMK